MHIVLGDQFFVERAPIERGFEGYKPRPACRALGAVAMCRMTIPRPRRRLASLGIFWPDFLGSRSTPGTVYPTQGFGQDADFASKLERNLEARVAKVSKPPPHFEEPRGGVFFLFSFSFFLGAKEVVRGIFFFGGGFGRRGFSRGLGPPGGGSSSLAVWFLDGRI